MPLPKQVDATVREALERGVFECAKLADDFERNANAPALEVPRTQIRFDPYSGLTDEGTETVSNPLWDLDHGQFERARQAVLTILELLGGGRPPLSSAVKRVEALKVSVDGAQSLRGIIDSTKESYVHGMFEPLFAQIERSVAGDYLSQAEELLEEGQRGRSDHVPAAVLLGAIFEKRLRTLCLAQSPPIDLTTPAGDHKKANVLIDDLKKAGVYGETKAKELRWIAGVRNHAAHGEFDKFSRADVERMQTAVGHFVEGD
jgi:hypothetical protein